MIGHTKATAGHRRADQGGAGAAPPHAAAARSTSSRPLGSARRPGRARSTCNSEARPWLAPAGDAAAPRRRQRLRLRRHQLPRRARGVPRRPRGARARRRARTSGRELLGAARRRPRRPARRAAPASEAPPASTADLARAAAAPTSPPRWPQRAGERRALPAVARRWWSTARRAAARHAAATVAERLDDGAADPVGPHGALASGAAAEPGGSSPSSSPARARSTPDMVREATLYLPELRAALERAERRDRRPLRPAAEPARLPASAFTAEEAAGPARGGSTHTHVAQPALGALSAGFLDFAAAARARRRTWRPATATASSSLCTPPGVLDARGLPASRRRRAAG